MTIRLKPLAEQVLVITGASSGIGLATARMAADKGARLVLASRSDEALQTLVDEIRDKGGQAIHVTADVASEEDVLRIAAEGTAAFGGFDTWVNNAGVSVYGRTHEAPIDDLRRMFETNFWGVVYGSRVASEHLRQHGGAIINIGSELSDVAAPLQGMYSASKHAVKGWTDALRMELQDEDAPISVTLIKPAAIDTPYADHAGNEMGDHPQHVPPVYSPDAVAEAILHAATTPTRDLFVGSAGMVASTLNRIAPGIMDRVVRRILIPGTHSGEPRHSTDALYQPGEGLQERGHYPGLVRSSLYTKAKMNRVVTGAATLGAGLVALTLWRSRRD